MAAVFIPVFVPIAYATDDSKTSGAQAVAVFFPGLCRWKGDSACEARTQANNNIGIKLQQSGTELRIPDSINQGRFNDSCGVGDKQLADLGTKKKIEFVAYSAGGYGVNQLVSCLYKKDGGSTKGPDGKDKGCKTLKNVTSVMSLESVPNALKSAIAIVRYCNPNVKTSSQASSAKYNHSILPSDPEVADKVLAGLDLGSGGGEDTAQSPAPEKTAEVAAQDEKQDEKAVPKPPTGPGDVASLASYLRQPTFLPVSYQPQAGNARNAFSPGDGGNFMMPTPSSYSSGGSGSYSPPAYSAPFYSGRQGSFELKPVYTPDVAATNCTGLTQFQCDQKNSSITRNSQSTFSSPNDGSIFSKTDTNMQADNSNSWLENMRAFFDKIRRGVFTI